MRKDINMKKNRSRGWSMNTNGKILITLIVAILAIKGAAQNWGKPYARQIILERPRTVPDNVRIRETMKGTNYVIIAIDDRKSIYDADDVPLGINVQRYLLVEDAWMQTVGKNCGDMLFDGDTLPFDRGGGALFSVAKYIKYKKIDYDEAGIQPKNKPLYECSELAARLEVQRTMHRYADTVIDKYCKNRSQRHKICDSLFCPIDSVFLYLSIPTEEVIPFKLVANDTCLIEEESFKSDGRGLYLPDSVWRTILSPIDTTLIESQDIFINRVQIIPQGHVPSFIKSVSLVMQPDVLVDNAAIPNMPIPTNGGLWEWVKKHLLIVIVCIMAILAVVLVAVLHNISKESQEDLEKYKQAFESLVRKLRRSENLSFDEKVILLENIIANREAGPMHRELKDLDRIQKLEKQIHDLEEKNKHLLTELSERRYQEENLRNSIEQIKHEASNEIKSLEDHVKSLKEENEKQIFLIRKELNNNPDQIDEGSPTGVLVRKGRFLDKAKINVKLIREDKEGWIGDSELKQFIECIVNPDEILRSKRTNTGLYKLMFDINNIIAPNAIAHNTIGLGDLKYNWLKDRLIKVIESYNKYLETEMVASRYGSDHFDTSCLEPIVKHVYDDASRYLILMSYKNYWANIVKPLHDVLGNLQNHDEAFNTRALMFYASQLYSMSCIMNRMYGDMRFATKSAELNVSLFNTDGVPALSPWGFPILDYASLMSCRYENASEVGEDAKVKYLRQFKPLPFIFISSYYDDNILS